MRRHIDPGRSTIKARLKKRFGGRAARAIDEVCEHTERPLRAILERRASDGTCRRDRCSGEDRGHQLYPPMIKPLQTAMFARAVAVCPVTLMMMPAVSVSVADVTDMARTVDPVTALSTRNRLLCE